MRGTHRARKYASSEREKSHSLLEVHHERRISILLAMFDLITFEIISEIHPREANKRIPGAPEQERALWVVCLSCLLTTSCADVAHWRLAVTTVAGIDWEIMYSARDQSRAKKMAFIRGLRYSNFWLRFAVFSASRKFYL